jgi:hypothetical protein
MIGKNVGIRRARGRFLLATNIDILFNDELMRFLKAGRLQQGKIYRIDRTDVETNVPVDASVVEQLAYCRSHHLRTNRPAGTFPLSPEGLRIVQPIDVATRESGIVPMEGACGPEFTPDGQLFSWAGGDLHLATTAPADHPRRLLVELSPGPCLRRLPATIEVWDRDTVVARGNITGHCVVALTLPLAPGERKVFVVRAVEGGHYPAPKSDPRTLDFALHRLSWSEDAPPHPPRNPEDAFRLLASELLPDGDVISPRAGMRLDTGWHWRAGRRGLRYRWADSGASLILGRPDAARLDLRAFVGSGPNVRADRRATLQVRDEWGRVLAEVELRRGPHGVNLPSGGSREIFLHVLEEGVPLTGRRAVQAFRLFSCDWSDAPLSQRLVSAAWGTVARLAFWGRDLVRPPVPQVFGQDVPVAPETRGPRPFRPPKVHTNACGDFTLLAREHWFELGAYAELEMYSLHIDSLFIYAAHYAGIEEVILPDEMRAYHIEHSAGSGWTPEGENRLFDRLRSKGIPVLTVDELYGLAQKMQVQGDPRLYSSAGWGLEGESLPETRIAKSGGTLAA